MTGKPNSFEKRLAKDACRIAMEGGSLLKKFHESRSRTRFCIASKMSSIDLVTDVDRKAEKAIKDLIEAAHPDHGIISEEGSSKKSACGYVWYVDPLDGTTNFVHGYPHFSVSVAVEYEGEVLIGCVYDPLRDELFFAQKGMGARLNGRRIQVSRSSVLDESLLVTGFPYDIRSAPENNIAHWNDFLMKARAVRRDGSAALDLCYVAAGRLDGFWEIKLKPWDIAAGLLMVSEAGGKTGDFHGNRIGIFAGEVLADNGHIHNEMIEVLKKGS